MVKVRVGQAQGAAPRELPRIELAQPRLEEDQITGFEAVGRVTNASDIEQKRLVIFCVARKAGKVVAAGRAIVDRLAPRQAQAVPRLLHRRSARRTAERRRPADGAQVMEVTMEATTQVPIGCAGCGAALAADQRYCLHCGAPQGDPRVAYRELIDPARSAAAHGATAVHPIAAANGAPFAHAAAFPHHPPARDWTPLFALGALGTLALVLVVGVLIGKSGTADPVAAPPPQVITISGGAPAAATPTDASTDDSGDGSGKKDGKGKGSDADKVDTKAGAQAVQDLNSASGDDYQKKSARLPDTVALPGEPPPKDDKAPGGGSDAETIG